MKFVDRYILRQLMGPFIFFLFVFGGILWLNQALRIVDVVIENGQSGMVFVELSIYLLPRVVESVFPLAGFASALYLTNRLYAESEYVVLMASGQTPMQFARPFIVFGVICFVLVSTLAHFLTPGGLNAFQQRKYEIRQEYLAKLIKVGEFISPQKDITVYFGHLRDDGLLEDILIRETLNLQIETIHTAPTGHVVDQDGDTKLVLIDGILQKYDPETRLLEVIKFDSFSYDLSQFSKDTGPRVISSNATITPGLPWTIAGAAVEDQSDAIEAQSRLVKSLFSLVMPLLGAAILFSGNFSRAGFYYRIVLAVMVLLGLNTFRGASQNIVEKTPALSFVLYSPVVLSVFIIIALIIMTQKGWVNISVARFMKKKPVAT